MAAQCRLGLAPQQGSAAVYQAYKQPEAIRQLAEALRRRGLTDRAGALLPCQAKDLAVGQYAFGVPLAVCPLPSSAVRVLVHGGWQHWHPDNVLSAAPRCELQRHWRLLHLQAPRDVLQLVLQRAQSCHHIHFVPSLGAGCVTLLVTSAVEANPGASSQLVAGASRMLRYFLSKPTALVALQGRFRLSHLPCGLHPPAWAGSLHLGAHALLHSSDTPPALGYRHVTGQLPVMSCGALASAWSNSGALLVLAACENARSDDPSSQLVQDSATQQVSSLPT